MYENRRRTHGWGARAVNVRARVTLWMLVVFVLTAITLFAIEDARDLYADAEARVEASQSWACDSLPAWAKKP